MTGFTPKRGDLVWIDFSPHSGREQAGRRPALVLSPEQYNDKVGLAVMCPVTSKEKGYPFEVRLPPACPIQGVILADHVKNMDWRARRTSSAGRAQEAVIDEVLGKLNGLLS